MRAATITGRNAAGGLVGELANAAGIAPLPAGWHPVYVCMRQALEQAGYPVAKRGAAARAATAWFLLAHAGLRERILGGETFACAGAPIAPYVNLAAAWRDGWKGYPSEAETFDWQAVFPTQWGHVLGPVETKAIMLQNGSTTPPPGGGIYIPPPLDPLYLVPNLTLDPAVPGGSGSPIHLDDHSGEPGPAEPLPTHRPTAEETAAILVDAREAAGPQGSPGARLARAIAWANARIAELAPQPLRAQAMRNFRAARNELETELAAAEGQAPPADDTGDGAKASSSSSSSSSSSTLNAAAPLIGTALGGLVGALVGSSVPGKNNGEIGSALGAIAGGLLGLAVRE